MILGLVSFFVVITLGPALVGFGTLLDVDTLTSVPPFRAVSGSESASAITCRTDTIDYYMPGIAEIKRGVFAGDVPTWAPYEVGGSPLASLPNHGALSPLSIPYFLLPLWLAPAVVKLGEVVVSILGMVLFLGRHGVSRGAGLLAGLVFASSGFMMMWTNWPHTKVAAFIPLLFWAVDRAVVTCDRRSVAAVALVVASMLLGGFPAVTLYSLTWAAAYALVRAVLLTRRRVVVDPSSDPGQEPDRLSRQASTTLVARRLVAPAGGLGLGLGLSAIQVLPFAANISQLDFAGRDEHGQHLRLSTALTTVAPAVRGLCVGGDRSGSINPIEAVGFVGGPAMVLLVVGFAIRNRCASERAPTAFLGLGALAMGLAIWVGGPVLGALELLPLYSSNFIGRGLSVFGFLAAALVGVGFDRLSRDPDGTTAVDKLGAKRHVRHGWSRLSTAVVLALVATTIVVGSAWHDAARDGYSGRLEHALVVPAGLIVLAIVSVAVALRASGLKRRVALLVLAVLVVGQSTAFAHTVLPTSDREAFYPTTPTHRFLHKHLGQDRYGAPGNNMFPPTSDYYRLRTPVGHEFTDPRWKDLLAAAGAEQRTVTYSRFPLGMSFEQVRNSPVLDQLATRYWVGSPRRPVGRADKLSGPGGRVLLSAGGSAACSVQSGPIRGIEIGIAEPMPASSSGTTPTLHVELRHGDLVREGAVLLGDDARARRRLAVAVAGEDLPSTGRLDLRLWVTGTDEPLAFQGSQGQLSCAAVRARDDGVHLVFTDAGGSIYRRVGSLPRVRWASNSRVVTDADERVAQLTEGVPDETVLLEDGGLSAAEGGIASVDLVEDGPERISVDVDADAFGYLVVADSLVRPGWSATVDGRDVPLVRGNHAFAALGVPAGNHRVELVYSAPGLVAGKAVTSGSVAVLLLLLGLPWLRRRLARPDRVRTAARVDSSRGRTEAGDQQL